MINAKKIEDSFIANLEYFVIGALLGIVIGFLLAWGWSTEKTTPVEPATPVEQVAPVQQQQQSEVERQEQAIALAIADIYPVSRVDALAIVRAATTASTLYQVKRELILAVIASESSFDRFAVSSVGAEGLMQVWAKHHTDLVGDGDLTNINFNVSVGTQILKDCLNRKGNLFDGLACYNGAVTPSKKVVYYKTVRKRGNAIAAQLASRVEMVAAN